MITQERVRRIKEINNKLYYSTFVMLNKLSAGCKLIHSLITQLIQKHTYIYE